MRVTGLVFAALVAACAALPHAHMPAQLTDESEIDKLMAGEEGAAGEDFHFPLRFDIPLDDDFKETVFLAESQQVNPVPPSEADNADQPVTCETICRPMNESEQRLAGAAAAYAKEAGNPEGKDAEAKAKKQKVESEEPAAAMLVELDRKICKAQGGAFSDETSVCEPFMRSTERSVKYEGEAIFSACSQEFGSSYTPCSPYQALALSHIFEIPDHAYYWLWPGGRADQVSNAVFKQQAGHNPTQGMDKCKDGHHVGFFHNWDQAHVDSWGCLHDNSDLRVLCCRRG